MSNILASLPTTTTSLQIKFTVDPTSAAAFFAALKPVQAYVITLPEFVSLDIYHNPSMPGEFKFTEVWNASVEWIMKATKESEVLREFIATMDRISVKPKEVEIWCPLKKEEWIAAANE